MLRARYYDASVGKWVSEDPIGFAAGDSNLARYVGNSVVGQTDPTGWTPEGTGKETWQSEQEYVDWFDDTWGIGPFEEEPEPSATIGNGSGSQNGAAAGGGRPSISGTIDASAPSEPELQWYEFNGPQTTSLPQTGQNNESPDPSSGSTLANVQLALDVIGAIPIPIVGEVADGLNVIIALSQGQWGNAAISAIGIIPIVGDVAKLGKAGSALGAIGAFFRRTDGLVDAAAANNRALHEQYIAGLRRQMSRPHAVDPTLAEHLDTLYRPGARLGSGSSADAARVELAFPGASVGGANHIDKVKDSVVFMQRWLKNNPNARPGDIAAAENVLKDLLDALTMKPVK